MKIVYEDTVDFEPLQLRFLIDGTPSSDRCEAVSRFVTDWMSEQERKHPEDWKFCQYSSRVLPSGVIEAFCELMPSAYIESLADAVAQEYPFVCELRLGDKEHGSALLSQIDWIKIPAGMVTIDGTDTHVRAFTINFTSITVGQFESFLNATGYIPIPDRLLNDPGYTISHFKLNFGKSPKIPLFGLTYDDGVAFADWVGCRLPTDPELRLFYETAMVRMKKKVNWDGETWTSTPAGHDMFYVRSGPCREIPDASHDPYRKPLHRHHYEMLEAPAVRVVKI